MSLPASARRAEAPHLPGAAVPATGPVALPPARAGEAPRRLAGVQRLRGVAALAVVLYHASVYLSRMRGVDGPLAWFGETYGLYGVAVFFVISGYLMAVLLPVQAPATFLAHRVARIYPAYLVIAALAMLATALVSGPGRPDLFALLLVPAGTRHYVLGVEWTLVFEVAFYVALYALALAGGVRFLVPAALGWLALVVAAVLLAPGATQASITPTLHLLPLSAANAAFIGGLLLPGLLARGFVPRGAALAGLALAAATPLLDLPLARLLAALGGTLIVADAVRAGASRGFAARALGTLGDWSYALYLCHVPIMIMLFGALPPGVPGGIAWGLAVALPLLASAGLGRLDLALHARAKAKVIRADPDRLRRAALGFAAVFVAVSAVASGFAARGEAARARAVGALEALAPGAFASPATARAAIAAAGLIHPRLTGALDRAETMAGGALLARGWVLDPADPGASVSVGIAQDGALLGVVRPGKRRPDIAASLARPDLTERRIGIAQPLRGAVCGTLVAVAVAPDGRMAALEVAPKLPGCP